MMHTPDAQPLTRTHIRTRGLIAHESCMSPRVWLSTAVIASPLRQRWFAAITRCCGAPAAAAAAVATPAAAVAPKSVAYWLFGTAGVVFGMVVVGGYTRLSRAGAFRQHATGDSAG